MAGRRPVFNRGMKARFSVVYIIILIGVLYVCYQLSLISRNKGEEYTITVLGQQQYKSETIPFKRGDIYDRNGYTLATSVKVYNLILDDVVLLDNEKYYEPTIDALVTCFDLNESELKTTISENPKGRYVVLKKKLDYDVVKQYKEYVENSEDKELIKGVWFENSYERKYPYSALGCKVIGFTYDDNEASEGIEGIYNDKLNGINGRQYGYVNSENDMEQVVRNAVNGYNLTSTIDMEIQSIVEEKIEAYFKEINPQRIAVMIMDPNSGEILAMADNISYDLNNPRDLSSFYSKKELKKMSDEDQIKEMQKIWRNFCVCDGFEPGSTMKPFTVAAALEENKVTAEDTFFCDGGEEIGGWTIKCSDTHGTIDLQETIVYSCNDALMQIGSKLGASALSNYQTRFGFGVRTGIDLSGETPGQIYSEEEMDSSSLATNSFGQNVTVNMVQIAAGFSSLVNGGYYYQPHVVKEISDEEGNIVENYSKTLIKQTVTSETSDFIKGALRETVLRGTGFRAEIEGYTVGGKTGTAEKLPRGNGEFVLSFIGAVPCEDPEVVCYVLIDSPEEDTDNSAYATRFFNIIMSEVLPYMNVAKTETEEEAKRAKKNSGYEENYIDGILKDEDAEDSDDETVDGETVDDQDLDTDDSSDEVSYDDSGDSTYDDGSGDGSYDDSNDSYNEDIYYDDNDYSSDVDDSADEY